MADKSHAFDASLILRGVFLQDFDKLDLAIAPELLASISLGLGETGDLVSAAVKFSLLPSNLAQL